MSRLSFRDRFFTPPVARAIWSPLGILLFGVATAIGIVVGLPVVAAVGAGVVAYGAKVGVAIPRNTKGDRIDPFVLKEPWRGYVQSAQSAKLRFDRTVDGTRSGPIRDHLSQLSARLDEGIEESWRIASRGNDIDGAIAQLSTAQAERELAQLRAQSAQSGEGGSADVASTIQSLEAQINSAQRMQRVSTTTRDKLRLLDARFDELVARAVEVSVGSADSDVLGNDVDDLVSDLEGLRLAIDDTKRAETGDLTSPEPSPDQTSPDQTSPDQTSPDQTSPEPLTGTATTPLVVVDPPTSDPGDTRPQTRPPR